MGLLRFIGQYADGLVKLGEDFCQAGIGLLHDEGSKVLGFALLHRADSQSQLSAFFADSLKLLVRLLYPLLLLSDGLAEGGDNLVACAVLDCY